MSRPVLFATLFLFLFVVFVLGYRIAADSPALGVLVFLGGVLAVFFVLFRRSVRGAHANNRGLTLLGEGRLVEALASFEEAQKDMGRNPLPRFNAGFANLWLWRLEEARVALDGASKTLRGKPLRMIAAPALLLIASLQNERARADELARELATLKVERSSVAAMSQAVWHARGQRWSQVLDSLSLERTRPLGGPARAVADALRAWASAELGMPRAPVDTVGVFGETGPSAVGKWWPEFAQFLERVSR